MLLEASLTSSSNGKVTVSNRTVSKKYLSVSIIARKHYKAQEA